MEAKSIKYRKIVENLLEMKDVVIPILGEDIFYVSTPEKPYRTIHEYLLDCFIDEYGNRNMTDEDKAMIVNGSYYGLSKLERFFPSDFETDYRCYIRNARKKDWVKIEGTVRKFLEVFQFPLLITTTCFDFIEEMLSGTRYTATAYYPKGINTAHINPTDHTVYHIFGTIADGGQWVYDEDKLLEFLHALHNTDTSSVALKQYIDLRNCRLLAIGCNLPDWLFRFLWYPLGSGSADTKQKKGYWINSRDITDSFNDFLDNIKFYSAREVSDILQLAVDMYSEAESSKKPVETDAEYDAFISYASEDKPIAERIFGILTKKGYKIWFDKDGKGKIEPGSNYMKRIAAGIRHSKFYIPVVTGNFLTKAFNPESNLKKEIDLVRAYYKSEAYTRERYSIPIIVEGSSFNENIITSTLIEDMTRFILPKQLFREINMYVFSPTDIDIDFSL